MGREVRLVPPGWKHPRDAKGDFIPLHGGDFAAKLLDWNRGAQKWKEGFRLSDRSECKKWIRIEPEHRHNTYAEWAGARPRKDEYMPRFRKGTAMWYYSPEAWEAHDRSFADEWCIEESEVLSQFPESSGAQAGGTAEE